jgi:hypothetical protein
MPRHALTHSPLAALSLTAPVCSTCTLQILGDTELSVGEVLVDTMHNQQGRWLLLSRLAPTPFLRSAFVLDHLRAMHGTSNGDGNERGEEAGTQIVRSHSSNTFLPARCTYQHHPSVGVISRPFPLTTVALQKLAARKLKFSSQHTMQAPTGTLLHSVARS